MAAFVAEETTTSAEMALSLNARNCGVVCMLQTSCFTDTELKAQTDLSNALPATRVPSRAL